MRCFQSNNLVYSVLIKKIRKKIQEIIEKKCPKAKKESVKTRFGNFSRLIIIVNANRSVNKIEKSFTFEKRRLKKVFICVLSVLVFIEIEIVRSEIDFRVVLCV